MWQIVVGWDVVEGSLWDIHWDSCGSDRVSTLVPFSGSSEGNLEGKPGTLERFYAWAVWVFISPLYIFLGGIQMWGENILCLLLIIIVSWGM